MENIKYIYKDTFAVIGKPGQGSSDSPQTWIPPLWTEANANFPEIAGIIRKTENGAPLGVWGVMNDVDESNKRWGTTGKYMAGCEADIDIQPPAGWTKWIIPGQTYIAARCAGDEYAQVFGKITGDPNIKIVGTVHERYPEPGNPNIVELYFPIAAGMTFCQSCTMPMTKPEDFSENSNYCKHCWESGTLRQNVTMEVLATDVGKLIDIEAAHPNLLSTPLLDYIKGWLAFDEAEKEASIPALHAQLVNGQDCDFMGTPWEKEWLADGRVCHCMACVAARKCISDIATSTFAKVY